MRVKEKPPTAEEVEERGPRQACLKDPDNLCGVLMPRFLRHNKVDAAALCYTFSKRLKCWHPCLTRTVLRKICENVPRRPVENLAMQSCNRLSSQLEEVQKRVLTRGDLNSVMSSCCTEKGASEIDACLKGSEPVSSCAGASLTFRDVLQLLQLEVVISFHCKAAEVRIRDARVEDKPQRGRTVSCSQIRKH